MPKASYCLDTCFFEQAEKSDNAKAFLKKISKGEVLEVLSTVVIYEYLTRCYHRGKIDEGKKLFGELAKFSNLLIIDLNPEIAKKAAQIHHTYNIPSCDAMIVATGMVEGCKYIVSEDADFSPIKHKIKPKKFW